MAVYCCLWSKQNLLRRSTWRHLAFWQYRGIPLYLQSKSKEGLPCVVGSCRNRRRNAAAEEIIGAANTEERNLPKHFHPSSAGLTRAPRYRHSTTNRRKERHQRPVELSWVVERKENTTLQELHQMSHFLYLSYFFFSSYFRDEIAFSFRLARHIYSISFRDSSITLGQDRQ